DDERRQPSDGPARARRLHRARHRVPHGLAPADGVQRGTLRAAAASPSHGPRRVPRAEERSRLLRLQEDAARSERRAGPSPRLLSALACALLLLARAAAADVVASWETGVPMGVP